ncbi:MAG: hypothetical protein NT092_13345 [Bacteroidia bacterium]|nr:hypothetical protein [Bacteroidia bacterium]
MWCQPPKYGISALPVVLLALLSFDTTLYAQEKTVADSVKLSRPYTVINLPPAGSLLQSEELMEVHDSLIPSGVIVNINRALFYDSLKIKASRYLITKKLYDILVISNKPSSAKQVSESSQLGFSGYSGKIIRNITIKRLDVFGTDIKDPLLYHPSRTEAFLNTTHLNTNEFIIRNNLLFSSGDTISPLLISDNERLLRELPFIDESRIIIIPASNDSVDILVLTKDIYSFGADFEYKSLNKGSISVFDKNILGLGNELRLMMPYDSDLPDSPGFGIEYKINNIRRSFLNLNLFFFDGLGKKTYGFSLERKLVSSETKYAGGISIREMFTTEDLDTMAVPEPLKYNLQDYWISRSFLVDRASVKRLIFGVRYTNNNVFDHPFILPDSYYYLQKYRMFLGSMSFSMQKYYKTNLIYGYGRTEDIPYGGLITFTAGREFNEFKDRIYAGFFAATGHSVRPLGYFYTSAGVSTFMNKNKSEQGMLLLRTSYISNLFYPGSFRMRNFLMADYTRGFDRNTDEYLVYNKENSFSGFRNDSVVGEQRLSVNLETVLFSPRDLYGFRFAFFAFGGLGYLFGTNEFVGQGEMLSSVGIGVRIRNNNLVFNTFQIRFTFFPNLPQYSRTSYFTVSGEQLLKPGNFDPGPPTILPYR